MDEHRPDAPPARLTRTNRTNRTHTRSPRLVAAVVVALLALTGLACSSSSSDGAEAADTTTSTLAPGGGTATAVREIMGQIPAPEAPGYTQYLMRVTIPPGLTLAPHHHPGLELAHIDAGELTYTILQGTAQVGRAGSETPTEEVTAPTTIVLGPGDTVYEHEDMHHMAENRGDVPVVIYLASLLASDQPISIDD